VPAHVLPELPLDPVVGVEERPVTCLDVLDLGGAVRHGAGAAEEELQQQLGSHGFEPRG